VCVWVSEKQERTGTDRNRNGAGVRKVPLLLWFASLYVCSKQAEKDKERKKINK